MPRIESLPPYQNYRVYKVFHKKTGRFLALLVNEKQRTTIGYAKYVLETSLGRRLGKGCEAHHKDDNKTNDVISNLEEKPRNEHLKEHASKRKPRLIELTCSKCKIKFIRRYNEVTNKIKNGQTKFYCCRSHQISCQRPAIIRHGTANAYGYHKCRCKECKEGQRLRGLDFRKKQRSNLPP